MPDTRGFGDYPKPAEFIFQEWKTRAKLERYDQRADYSLLVSIHAPEVDVELYPAIENQIEISVEA